MNKRQKWASVLMLPAAAIAIAGICMKSMLLVTISLLPLFFCIGFLFAVEIIYKASTGENLPDDDMTKVLDKIL